MPREITHWAVLEETRKRLAFSAPWLSDIITQHLEGAYLGALLHDAPLFHKAGKSDFQRVSEVLHGTNGDDTLTPLRNLALSIQKQQQLPKELSMSITVGLLSHYACDATFHPMVYYFTGNYYDSNSATRRHAQTLHRRFEVYLDSYFAKRYTFWNGYSILKITQRLEPKIEDLAKWLAEKSGINLEQNSAGNWAQSIRALAFYQSLFRNNLVGFLYNALNRTLWGRLAPVESLFRYGREAGFPLFEGEIHYKNPSDGTEHTATLETLLQRSAAETERLALQLDLTQPLFDEPGRSLNFGLPNAPVSQAHHFLSQRQCERSLN